MNGGTRPRPIPLRSMQPQPRRNWWTRNGWFAVAFIVMLFAWWLLTGDAIMRWLWGVR